MIYVGNHMWFFIPYDIWCDVQYLVSYHDISPGIRYLIYNFVDWYIADIRYLKHWSTVNALQLDKILSWHVWTHITFDSSHKFLSDFIVDIWVIASLFNSLSVLVIKLKVVYTHKRDHPAFPWGKDYCVSFLCLIWNLFCYFKVFSNLKCWSLTYWSYN